MAGFTPTEGAAMCLEHLLKGSSADRGTNLELLLFTNTSLTLNTTAATLTEPTGGGYARVTLSDGSWMFSGGIGTYAPYTFTLSGSDYSADVYGYAIVSTGTTPRIVAIENDPDGAKTLINGDTYTIPMYLI